MQVQELMTDRVFTVGPDDSLDRAATLMWDRDVGVVPVVDPDGRVCGIVTDRDVAMCALHRGAALRDLRVSHAMTAEVFTCAPGDEVGLAERVMAARQVRRLPIVDPERRLVGLLSINDLARASSYREGPGVPVIEVGRTLQKVCQHRHPGEGASR